MFDVTGNSYGDPSLRGQVKYLNGHKLWQQFLSFSTLEFSTVKTADFADHLHFQRKHILLSKGFGHFENPSTITKKNKEKK